MELQVGVKILLKNSEGKYLLIRRSAEKYPEVGARWDIVGGRIDGEPKLDGDHSEFGWFGLEEIKKLDNLDIYFKELLERNLILS